MAETKMTNEPIVADRIDRYKCGQLKERLRWSFRRAQRTLNERAGIDPQEIQNSAHTPDVVAMSS
jgi:hypothetical protein